MILNLPQADQRNYFISAYFEGCAYFLTPGPSSLSSVFGGPPPVTISGISGTILQPEKLHYVGRISQHDIPALGRHISEIPLFYGFTFDGCELWYEVDSSSRINLMDLDPARPLIDYPYPDYPPILPLIPLRLGDKQRMTYAKFSTAYPNLEENQPADLVVALPPVVSHGISLWGTSGDGNDVTVVFEYDFDERTVRAYNRCT